MQSGWLAGPYASSKTGRWMIDTAIKGDWQIDEEIVLTPMLRVAHSMRWLSRDLFVEQDSIDGLRQRRRAWCEKNSRLHGGPREVVPGIAQSVTDTACRCRALRSCGVGS